MARPLSFTRYDSAATEAAVRALFPAGGSYQLALIGGDAAWSGSDLRGTARRFSARYHATRCAVVARLTAAGFRCQWTTDARWRCLSVSAPSAD